MKGCQILLKVIGWCNILLGGVLALISLVLWLLKPDFTEYLSVIQEEIRDQLGPTLEMEIIDQYLLIVIFVIGLLILIYGLLAHMAGKNPKKSLPILVLSIINLVIGLVDMITGSSIDGSYLLTLGISLATFVAALILFIRTRS